MFTLGSTDALPIPSPGGCTCFWYPKARWMVTLQAFHLPGAIPALWCDDTCRDLLRQLCLWELHKMLALWWWLIITWCLNCQKHTPRVYPPFNLNLSEGCHKDFGHHIQTFCIPEMQHFWFNSLFAGLFKSASQPAILCCLWDQIHAPPIALKNNSYDLI